MSVSIFIPTGNRATSLEKVLLSLTRQAYKKFEVIIVDYKSTDNTQWVINKYKKLLKIKVIQQKTKGLTMAANLALRHTAGKIFIRTDDDVVMDKGWLKAIVDTFASSKKIGGVTGPAVIPVRFRSNRDLLIIEQKFRLGSPVWKLIGRFYFGYLMDDKQYESGLWLDSGAFSFGSNFPRSKKFPQHEVTNLEPCNYAVRTKLLKAVGGFDPIYTGVGENHEADAAFKIVGLGFKLMFNPKASLAHCPSRQGFFNDRPSSYSRMLNFIIFYKRNIKLDSFRKVSKFFAYLIFQNCYYIYAAAVNKQPKQLGAIPGTIVGFLK